MSLSCYSKIRRTKSNDGGGGGGGLVDMLAQQRNEKVSMKDNKVQSPCSNRHDDDDGSFDGKKKRGELQLASASMSVAESNSSLTEEPSSRSAESNLEKIEDLGNSTTSRMIKESASSKNKSEQSNISAGRNSEKNVESDNKPKLPRRGSSFRNTRLKKGLSWKRSDSAESLFSKPPLIRRLSSRKSNADSEDEAPTCADGVLPSNVRVLVVDDDKILRKMVIQLIKRVEPSWNVKEAEDGETALDMVLQSSKNRFHLLFVDQYMSSSKKEKMMGTEVVKAMREKGVTAKICGLSANSLRDDFYKAGADSFLVKPFPSNNKILTGHLLELFK